nr:acid ceramidase [Mimivirus sp.]
MPVIMISNKTGFNIDFTRKFITSIKSRSYLDRMGLIKPIVNEITKNYPPVMYIDSTFNVHGTGIVLSGTCKYGSFKKGQRVYLGPINNTYIPITIKSIHNCISDNVDEIHKNESGSMGIRLDSKGSYTKEMFSKGQIVTTDIEFAKKILVIRLIVIFLFLIIPQLSWMVIKQLYTVEQLDNLVDLNLKKTLY